MIPEAIGFDERKDLTKVVVGEGIKGRKRFEMRREEHCAIVTYPGEKCAGHVVPEDGTGAGLAKGLHRFLGERRICISLF